MTIHGERGNIITRAWRELCKWFAAFHDLNEAMMVLLAITIGVGLIGLIVWLLFAWPLLGLMLAAMIGAAPMVAWLRHKGKQYMEADARSTPPIP